MSSDTAVVIPTFNEAENIADLVGQLVALEPRVDVIVVDDASPDGTGAIADELAGRQPDRVSLIHRSGKGGRGAAVLAGLRHAPPALPLNSVSEASATPPRRASAWCRNRFFGSQRVVR
jgi:glycosyltransferase involved in cell wall biosynthesis